MADQFNYNENTNEASLAITDLTVSGNTTVGGNLIVEGAGLSALTFTFTFAGGATTADSAETCPVGFIPLFVNVSNVAFANANTRTIDDLGKTGLDTDGWIDDAGLVLTGPVILAGATNVKVQCNGALAMGTAVANTAIPALEAAATLRITLNGALAAGETPTFTVTAFGAAQG